MDRFSLQGKVAVVADVKTSDGRLGALAEEIRKSGRRALDVKVDMSQKPDNGAPRLPDAGEAAWVDTRRPGNTAVKLLRGP
jgi:hypothetical protein